MNCLRRVILKACTAALGLVLTACSTTQALKAGIAAGMRNAEEPGEDTPHALLRVSTNLQIALTPGETCDTTTSPRRGVVVDARSVYIGARGLNGQLRGMVGQAPPHMQSAELRVAADAPHVVHFSVSWSDRNAWVCGGARIFTPRQGMQYQAWPLIDRETRRCALAVIELLPQPTPLQTTAAPRCAH